LDISKLFFDVLNDPNHIVEGRLVVKLVEEVGDFHAYHLLTFFWKLLIFLLVHEMNSCYLLKEPGFSVHTIGIEGGI